MDITQAAPRNAQYVVLTANGVLTDERALTGTANQVVITDNGAGSSVVLSLPQSIHTGASPTFAGLTLSGLTAGRVPYASTAGLLADTDDLQWTAASDLLTITSNGGAGSLRLTVVTDSTGGNQPTGVQFSNLSATASHTNSFSGVRYRGTVAAPRRTPSGDVLFRIGGTGAHAADDVSTATVLGVFRASLTMSAAEAFTSSAQGTVLSVNTTAIGTTTLAEAFRITDRGNLTLGANPGQPSTGTQTLIFADGTAPSGLASNTAGLYANDDAGTVKMYAIDEAGSVALLNYRSIALGGGAAPVVGTIGGSGPATATQASWIELNIGGTAYWVPAWQ